MKTLIRAIQTLLVLFIPFVMMSCQNEPSHTQPGPNEIQKNKAIPLEKKLNKLKKINLELQNKIEEIELNLDIEQKEKQELQEWSLALVKSFGPSVWYPGEWRYPLPHKRLPKATPLEIIKEINILFEQKGLPQIILNNISEDTIFISISNSEQLTERMGSFGAISYMNSVIYSISSLKEIQCVFFEFEEGSHAFPGKYCLEEPIRDQSYVNSN